MIPVMAQEGPEIDPSVFDESEIDEGEMEGDIDEGEFDDEIDEGEDEIGDEDFGEEF